MKAKNISKRVLSVILCTVMLFSCWVFTAPQADAATAGSYSYSFRMYLVDGDNADCDDNDGVHVYLNTKNINGSNNATKQIEVPGGGKSSTWKGVIQGKNDSTEVGTTSAGYFPISVTISIDFDGGGWRGCKFKWILSIGGTAIYTSGTCEMGGGRLFGHEKKSSSWNIDSSKYPKATKADSFSVSNVTIPTTGSTTTTASIGTVRDQYGVAWYQDGDGLSFTAPTGVSSSGKTITVASTAMLTASPWYKDITLTAKCGSTTLPNTCTLRITNPKYTTTWRWHNNGDNSTTWSGSTTKTGVYYNENPSAPSAATTTTKYYDANKHYSGGKYNTSAITGATTFNMTYPTSAAHKYTYSPIANNDTNHTASCSCGYNKAVEHTYGKYSDNGNGTHSRTCGGTTGCGYVETKAHTWGAWQIIPDGQSANYGNHDRMAKHYRVCTADGCKAKDYDNHTWVAQEKVAPTCTTDGHTPYKCSQCQLTTVDLNTDGDHIEDFQPMLGHDFQYNPSGTKTDTQHQEKCSRCTATQMVDHPSYGDWYEIDGTQHAHKCTVCQHEVKENHPESKWSGWQHAVPPADATGVRAIVREKLNDASYDATKQCFNYCTDCGYVKYQNHKWNDGVTTPAKCEEEGKTVYTCFDCENTKEEKIDALGHNWARWEGCSEEKVSELSWAVPVVFKCQNGCENYCASTYDEEAQEYHPTEVPGTYEEVVYDSVQIQTPSFNEHMEYFDGQMKPYQYRERKASLRVRSSEKEDDTQAMRFSGNLTAGNIVAAGVQFNVNPNLIYDNNELMSLSQIRAKNLSDKAKKAQGETVADAFPDDTVIDFGFVYTQAKYIRSAKETINYDLLTLDYMGKKNPATNQDCRIYRMSVVENNKGNGTLSNNWKGLTDCYNYPTEEAGEEGQYTFNLVINVNVKNYQATYCARTYVIYKYHGDIICVYDQPVLEEPIHSHDSVYNQAMKNKVAGELPQTVVDYLDYKIINRTIEGQERYVKQSFIDYDWNYKLTNFKKIKEQNS